MVSSTTPSDDPRWPPVLATVRDDRVADLDGQLCELDLVETAQVGGALDGREDRHGRRTPGSMLVSGVRSR